jgi:uncharacterized protein (TIGR00645 family)
MGRDAYCAEKRRRTEPRRDALAPPVNRVEFAAFPTSNRRIVNVKIQRTMESFIFWSRWLQAPLYLGLIVAQGVYVYQFVLELFHLVAKAGHLDDTEIMLIVLGLIDVVMIANLLIMVIIGGYETFVSRLDLEGHPDQPEWLSHVNAGVLKVKLATALIGISSIHLLRTFIKVSDPATQMTEQMVFWQVAIHVTFVLSAFAMAWTDRVMNSSLLITRTHGTPGA